MHVFISWIKEFKMDVFTIGIAGSSGSGKTTVACQLAEHFNQQIPGQCTLISSDNYYRDLSHLSMKERDSVNFDHPTSLDFDLLAEHLRELKQGRSIVMPDYDFTTHCRTEDSTQIHPTRMVMIEGILLHCPKIILPLLDAKLFIKTEPDLCFIRRLERDTRQRGRTTEQVIEQYKTTVKPMDDLFVKPCEGRADIVIENTAENYVDDHGLHFDLSPVTELLTSCLNGEQRLATQTVFNLFSPGRSLPPSLLIQDDAYLHAGGDSDGFSPK
jgi:uridine kinase